MHNFQSRVVEDGERVIKEEDETAKVVGVVPVGVGVGVCQNSLTHTLIHQHEVVLTLRYKMYFTVD